MSHPIEDTPRRADKIDVGPTTCVPILNSIEPLSNYNDDEDKSSGASCFYGTGETPCPRSEVKCKPRGVSRHFCLGLHN